MRWGIRSVGLAIAIAAILVTGCRQETTTPTPTDTAAVSPVGSVGVVGSSSSPIASPSADPGSAAVSRFIAFATDPTSSYQATFTGHQRATVTIVTIGKGVLQVHGKDVLVRATFTFPRGDAYTVEHRFVAGAAWLRTAPGAWGRMAPFTGSDSMAAFAAVHGPADVTYLGPTKVNGKTLYKVRIKSVIVNPVMVPAINLTEKTVTSSRFDLLIDPSGVPVRGDAEIDGSGRVSGQLQEIAIDLAVTFTKVGAPVSIKAP